MDDAAVRAHHRVRLTRRVGRSRVRRHRTEQLVDRLPHGIVAHVRNRRQRVDVLGDMPINGPPRRPPTDATATGNAAATTGTRPAHPNVSISANASSGVMPRGTGITCTCFTPAPAHGPCRPSTTAAAACASSTDPAAATSAGSTPRTTAPTPDRRTCRPAVARHLVDQLQRHHPAHPLARKADLPVLPDLADRLHAHLRVRLVAMRLVPDDRHLVPRRPPLHMTDLQHEPRRRVLLHDPERDREPEIHRPLLELLGQPDMRAVLELVQELAGLHRPGEHVHQIPQLRLLLVHPPLHRPPLRRRRVDRHIRQPRTREPLGSSQASRSLSQHPGKYAPSNPARPTPTASAPAPSPGPNPPADRSWRSSDCCAAPTRSSATTNGAGTTGTRPATAATSADASPPPGTSTRHGPGTRNGGTSGAPTRPRRRRRTPHASDPTRTGRCRRRRCADPATPSARPAPGAARPHPSTTS
jgi:hypothetical protein